MSGIARSPDVMAGRYCLRGTRMPVTQVKRMVRDAGREWVRAEFPWLTDKQIETAMGFRA